MQRPLRPTAPAETEIADGGIFPRLGSTEGNSRLMELHDAATVNGNGVLDTASSIPETQIADGAVFFHALRRNETITGNWSFSGDSKCWWNEYCR